MDQFLAKENSSVVSKCSRFSDLHSNKLSEKIPNLHFVLGSHSRAVVRHLFDVMFLAL